MYLCVNRIGNPSLCALIICKKKNKEFGVGEMMTQWIRALVDLLESLQYIPSAQGAVSKANMLPGLLWICRPLLPSAINASIWYIRRHAYNIPIYTNY